MKKRNNLRRNPWFLSLTFHLSLVFLLGVLYWLRSATPPILVVTLQPISASKPVVRSALDTHETKKSVPPQPQKPEKKKERVEQEDKREDKSIAESQFSLGIQTIKERYLSDLKQFFQRLLVYPAVSATLREKGRVEVAFTISRDGMITGITIHKPCAFQRLNQAAVSLVQRAGKFRPFPVQMTEQSMRLAIPIDYEI